MKKVKKIEVISNDFIVRWSLTSSCNKKCEYCIQRQYEKGASKLLDIDIIKSHANKINKAIADNYAENRVKLFLLGGECFLYDLSKVVSVFNTNKNIRLIQIESNFTFDNKKYKDFLLSLKDKHVYLFCSYHYQYWEDFDFLKKFKDLKDFIKDNNLKVEMIIQYTVTEKNFSIVKEQIKNISNYIDDNQRISVGIERGVDESIKHSQEVINFCNEHTKNMDTKKIKLLYDDNTYDIAFRNDILNNNIDLVKSKNSICHSTGKYLVFNSDTKDLKYRFRNCGPLIEYDEDEFFLHHDDIICKNEYCSLCYGGISFNTMN